MPTEKCPFVVWDVGTDAPILLKSNTDEKLSFLLKLLLYINELLWLSRIGTKKKIPIIYKDTFLTVCNTAIWISYNANSVCGLDCMIIQSAKHIKNHTLPLYQNFNGSHQPVSLKHDQICSSITWALLINYSVCSLIHSKILQLWDIFKRNLQRHLWLQAGSGVNFITTGFATPQRITGDMVQDKSKLIFFFFFCT